MTERRHRELRPVDPIEATGAEEPALDEAVEGVRELVDLVAHSSVTWLRLDLGPLRVEIEADPAGAPTASTASAASTVDSGPSAAPPASPPPDIQAQVTAPLPGVLYRRPAPSEEPFVSVGDRVDAGQQVAIVEAMKLMNVVVADCAGTVAEILVEDSAVVEFGQPIMTIERG